MVHLHKKEDLIAYHNQSVTDTTYYGDGFMSNFGGAKDQPNAYNFQYIWPAFNAVITNYAPADDLKNEHGFCLKYFDVLDEPKKKG